MYLYLAIFWFAFGVVAQIFWTTLEERAYIPVDRTVFGFVCFVLFSYNFLRWRMRRMMQKTMDDESPPPRPRVVKEEYDPSLDFTKPDDAKPKDEPKP